MPIQIHRPAERQLLKMLLYGPSGQGKTTFLGTAQADERTAPMLVLDFEGGTQSLAGLDIDVVSIRDWKDYNEVMALLQGGQKKYRSIAIDSVSETHLFALLKLLADPTFSRGKSGPDELAQRDYGVARVQMHRLLRSFRDLGLHVIFTAGKKDEIEPKVGVVCKPALAGALAEEVPALMDVVSYLSIATEKDEAGNERQVRSLLLHGYAKWRIKVRTPWGVTVPSEIDNPTLTKLLDVLQFKMPPSAAKAS